MTEVTATDAPPKPKRGRPPTGSGMHPDRDGYLVIHRGPWRNRYAHRAYAARQWKQTYGTDLPDTVEIHHSCGNRSCFPPSDGHLIIMDLALHHADNATRNRKCPRKRRKGKPNRNRNRNRSRIRKLPAQGDSQ